DTLFGWRVNCSSSDTLMLNTPADLVITEIMYNPPESGTDTSEFIEIYNNGASAINLQDFTCTGGIYTFPNVNLAAGA
ncbi:MAG: lamin tail domain-containing protein, partial [Flavobacteriales bacterium]|nr:lamin tail domain-containing protein [Flavobacteriales bacterium]